MPQFGVLRLLRPHNVISSRPSRCFSLLSNPISSTSFFRRPDQSYARNSPWSPCAVHGISRKSSSSLSVASSSAPPPPPPCGSRKKTIPFNLADIGEGITEVQILQWHIQEGDIIKQFDKIAEVQSDKAAVEITSRYDGMVKKLMGQVGEMLRVGQPLIELEVDATERESESHGKERKKEEKISSSSTDNSQTDKSEKIVNTSSSSSSSSSAALATPAVRAYAKQKQINDLSLVTPTGPEGRITKTDIDNYLQGKKEPKSDRHGRPSASLQTRLTSKSSKFQPLNLYQKGMLKSMTAISAVPHFGYTERINMEELVKIRGQAQSYVDQYQADSSSSPRDKITYMAFWIKALSMTLTEFPHLNARLHTQAPSSSSTPPPADLSYPSLETLPHHNIGIAMNTPTGLLVPVIHCVEQLSLRDIAARLTDLSGKARQGLLGSQLLEGGTITLSNIGAIGEGGFGARPLLAGSGSQLVIGAVSRVRRTLEIVEVGEDEEATVASRDLVSQLDIKGLAKNETVTAIHTAMVDWSADHRVVDGATLALFSARFKQLCENPSLMLLQLK